ncbi:MAG: hypothetical protein ACYTGW_03700 [Planctomycetota bacterium]|jgi:hypothetical protein
MFRLDRSTLTVAAMVTAATFMCATAQAQNSKVVPAIAATAEGNSSAYMPYTYDRGRTQQIWAAQAVAKGAAVLNSVNFRRDGNKSNYPAYSIAQHKVTIGHTSVSPATMSTTYTANITSTMTTVLNGAFSVAAQPAPTTPPAPFNYKYPLSTPFIYTAPKGNLIMEWVLGSGQATTKGGPMLDAVRVTAGGSGGVRQFGTWGKFAGNDPAKWTANATKLVPGGSADISLTGFGQAYTSRLFVGVSDQVYGGLKLPYDLGAIGAPGNFLYTGLDVIVGFTLKTGAIPGTWGANPIFPLPNDNKLIGLKALIQSYYADSKANAAGLVSSDAMELTIGSTGPASKMMGRDGTTNATGGFLSAAAVVQFVGAIN